MMDDDDDGKTDDDDGETKCRKQRDTRQRRQHWDQPITQVPTAATQITATYTNSTQKSAPVSKTATSKF